MTCRKNSQKLPTHLLFVIALSLCGLASVYAGEDDDYARATAGTRIFENEGGALIKILVEAANLGDSSVEVGELTLLPGARSGGHAHGALEIFYVVSGEMEHVVNGESFMLKPGMVGIVKAGDEVRHNVLGNEPCVSVVIWVPGGEAERISPGFKVRPITDVR